MLATGSEAAVASTAEVQQDQAAVAADDRLVDAKSLALCWRFLVQVLPAPCALHHCFVIPTGNYCRHGWYLM